jgi:hypothetical protein
MAAEPVITEHFFTDVGTYGAGQGRRLPERVKIERQIEQLTAQKWDNPDRRDEIDDMIAGLRARLRYLVQEPDRELARQRAIAFGGVAQWRCRSVSTEACRLPSRAGFAVGHVQAMEHGIPSERYILGGERFTVPNYFALISQICGRRPPRLVLPQWAMLGLGAGCTIARSLGIGSVRFSFRQIQAVMHGIRAKRRGRF